MEQNQIQSVSRNLKKDLVNIVASKPYSSKFMSQWQALVVALSLITPEDYKERDSQMMSEGIEEILGGIEASFLPKRRRKLLRKR